MMKSVLVLAICLAIVNCATIKNAKREVLQEWEAFKADHKREYSAANGEEDKRFNVWLKNRAFIAEHNSRYDNGEANFGLGMNHFGDWTDEEYEKYLSRSSAPDIEGNYTTPSNEKPPLRRDWREQGAVNPARDQGVCGSCWAFSAVAALEGQWALKKGKLLSFSEQQLVDCSRENSGCYGGFPYLAFRYIWGVGGIQSRSSYPYEDADRACRADRSKFVASVKGYKKIPAGDEYGLLEAVGSVGPISIAVDASLPTFKFYKHGIYDDTRCSHWNVNHAITAIGYDYDKLRDKPYWIIKNSWDPSEWGDKGFGKVLIGVNQCGIAQLASYPLV